MTKELGGAYIIIYLYNHISFYKSYTCKSLNTHDWVFINGPSCSYTGTIDRLNFYLKDQFTGQVDCGKYLIDK